MFGYMKKLRESLKPHLKRANGHSLQQIIATINPTLRGWYGYFKHSRPSALYDVDRWVRTRLRSILRKRRGLRGKGRGADHQRWPNRFFADLGLFSLEQSRIQACQAMQMAH
jgi:RNA-directed DNA polymerase